MFAAHFTVTDRALSLDEADERSRRVIDYWHSRRQERPAPTRRDIDPVDLKSFLGRLHL